MRYPLSNFRQLKLSNGEELIAEVLEWAADDDPTIVIRAALGIISTEREDGFRYYSMRPWMIYCEDMNKLLTINADTIIGETEPADILLKQYAITVSEYVESYTKQEIEDDKAKEPSTTTLEEALDLEMGDSDGNVVKLFSVSDSRKKMH
jgi:hypothetical protein